MAVYKKRHLPVSSLYGKAIGLEPVPRTLPFLGSTPFSFRRVWALRRLTSDALLKSKLQLKSEEIYLDSSSSSFTFLTVDGMAVEGLHPCVAFVVCKVTAFEISLWFASESNINNERSELSLRHWLTVTKWWWFCHLLLLLCYSSLFSFSSSFSSLRLGCFACGRTSSSQLQQRQTFSLLGSTR